MFSFVDIVQAHPVPSLLDSYNSLYQGHTAIHKWTEYQRTPGMMAFLPLILAAPNRSMYQRRPATARGSIEAISLNKKFRAGTHCHPPIIQ